MKTKLLFACLLLALTKNAIPAATLNNADLTKYLCRSKDDGYQMLVPGSCSQYYECSGGITKVKECPKYYDSAKRTCVDINPGCIESIIKPLDCKGPCCGVKLGYDVNPNNQTIYYECKDNCVVETNVCDKGEMFDLVTGKCSSPATCINCATPKPPCDNSTPRIATPCSTTNPTTTTCATTKQTTTPCDSTEPSTTPCSTTKSNTTSCATTEPTTTLCLTTESTTTLCPSTEPTTTSCSTTNSTTTTCDTTIENLTTSCTATTEKTTTPCIITTEPATTPCDTTTEEATTPCTTITEPTTTPCNTRTQTATTIPCEATTKQTSNIVNSDTLQKNIDKYMRIACSDKPNGFLLASLTSCNEYYICSNGEALRVDCGENYFNAFIGICDKPENTKCIQAKFYLN